MNIGPRLKQLRETRGLTLEQVGAAIGVNKATVQRYEIENIDIKRNTAIKLARVLGTSPAYIMGWTDDPSADTAEAAEVALPPRLRFLADSLEKLNEEGQEKLVDYAADLVASGRYIKSDQSSVGEKQA